MIVGLDHAFITIPEGREDDARRFYGALLGLEEIARPEGLQQSGGIWFRAGGQELHLGSDDAHEATKRPHPGFRVESVTALEELAHRVEAAGVETRWDERIEGASASTCATRSGTASSSWRISRRGSTRPSRRRYSSALALLAHPRPAGWDMAGV